MRESVHLNEDQYDKMLNIKTSGKQKGFLQSAEYHPYEPTPYKALEELFAAYEMKRSDRVVDFGCGKGRVIFYVHHRFQSFVTGVEMNEALHREAELNYQSYAAKHPAGKGEIQFVHGRAERYSIDPEDNRFYFFNPFSIRIFMKIIGNIQRSFEREPREMELLLYYPSEDYIYFLENHTSFEYKQEIALTALYGEHPYERFVIYRLGGS